MTFALIETPSRAASSPKNDPLEFKSENGTRQDATEFGQVMSDVMGPLKEAGPILSGQALADGPVMLNGFDAVLGAFVAGVILRRYSPPGESNRLIPKIEALGWDKLMEEFKKRLEEQHKRHQGGNKMVGTGGTSPFGAFTPRAARSFLLSGRSQAIALPLTHHSRRSPATGIHVRYSPTIAATSSKVITGLWLPSQETSATHQRIFLEHVMRLHAPFRWQTFL